MLKPLLKFFNPRQATVNHELHLRNIYALPTRTGFMLAATILLLLLTSINFQLNLGYALTFLIFGAASVSIVTASRTLYGLKLSMERITPVFAGEALPFSVDIENADARTRYAVGVAINRYPWRRDKNDWVWSDVLGLDRAKVTLAIPTTQRGWLSLPILSVETRFPMGIFRIWSVWQPAAKGLVYPALEQDAPLLSSLMPLFSDMNDSGRMMVTQSRGEEYDAIRPYRAGDPMKQIYWKKVLPSGELLSRETTTTQSTDIWLSLESTGLTHLESQLSRLAAWVLQAHKTNLTYGLNLAGQKIAPAAGETHQIACLEALALFKSGVNTSVSESGGQR